ncbi:uncharacterized protein LOC143354691 [Halictus rubicundus]|uniref:uncharacterized protein LOC143354691 n=1 Tax=Halictus rubicundus TaxID=77578 RepID=UPI004036D7E2
MPPRMKDARGGGRSRGTLAKEPPAKRRRSPPRRRGQKAKGKIRQGKYTLKLKGWLKTPADWSRFNAWAKVNALPKKYPEPEPIVRPSKPLSKLRKRIKIIALPKATPDPSILCRLDWSIPRTALKIVASKRLMLLALPRVKLCDYGRVYYKVSPAALKYEASERMTQLSKPRDCIREKRKFEEKVADLTEKCKSKATSLCEESRGIDEDRLNELAECKKLLKCPGVLTPEEIALIFTPLGVNRRALVYKITPWMQYIALPKYTRIKFRTDEAAKEWKKQIVEKGEERGKKALAEQQKKVGTKRKHDETEEEDGGGEGDAEDKPDEKEKEEKAKKRKLEKNAWRYTPYPCKEDAFIIRKSALKGKVPPGVGELAKPKVRKSRACKSNPFTVKKAALSASASGRVESLAKPRKPRDPVERQPPREKDDYGRPIIPMPPYGKVLPETKPYKMGECPSEDDKKEKKIRKKRPIDPIAYEATYDPCIDPELAKRQKRERKRAEKMMKKKPKKKRKQKKKEETPGEEQEEKEEEKEEEIEEEAEEE